MKPHHGVGRETHIPQIDSYHSNYLAFIHNCFFQFPIVTLPCHNLVNQLFKLINARVASCSSMCVQFLYSLSSSRKYYQVLQFNNYLTKSLRIVHSTNQYRNSMFHVTWLFHICPMYFYARFFIFSSFPFHTRCKKTTTFIISHVMCRHRKRNKLPILLQTLFNIFTEHNFYYVLVRLKLWGLVSLKCLATPFLNL